MNSHIQKIYVIVFLTLGTISCNPIKYLQDDEVFLVKNKIKISTKVVEGDEISPYLQQRENRRALWVFKLKMQQYLAFSESTINAKNEKKRAKHDIKNQKRLAAGKDTTEFKLPWITKIKESGEAPVIFDSTLVDATIFQFEKALFNHGYFNNEVFAEYVFNRDSTKVKVIYSTSEGDLYHINKVSLAIEDTNLVESIKIANENSTLHAGDPYNTDKIDAQRARFTVGMRDQGYYLFSKESLQFEVDSTVGNHQVNIKFLINNPTSSINKGDTLVKQNTHQKYKIGTVTLNTNYNPKFPNDLTDSIHFDDLVFINLSRLQYRPIIFKPKLFFKTGDYYSQTKQSSTYTRLSGLNNFKYINLNYSTIEVDSNILDCTISMTPLPTQSVGIEIEGTNTSGNLGISGYLSYTHRNIFKGTEHLKFRIKGGLENQITNTSDTENKNNTPFNTIEYGFETSLIFQNLVAPPFIRDKILRKFNRPKTSINFILNYQDRPDFERKLANASFGYTFTQKKVNTNEFFIYPLDISFIWIDKSESFTKRLEELNNPLLDATYDNQFIVGLRLLENWTNRSKPNQKTFILNRAQFETAGNMLNLFQLGNSVDTIQGGVPYDTISGVRYAQFVKIQNDFTRNSRINRYSSMAYRLLGGLGVAYGNAKALPYDRSFYGGGANDNRGWIARSLGPGSMIDSLKAGIDQVADIKLQVSAEYRFSIFKALEGAVFADAGNIWLFKEDPDRPNANFEWDRFYKEIALSTGIGLRFNFGFLLVRLDWGFKIIDPNLPEGERFVLRQVPGGYLDNYNSYSRGSSYKYQVLNLGIGYPF